MKLNDNYDNFVRYQVLAAASMKIAVFCVAATCSLVEVYRCFGDRPDDGAVPLKRR
jgi:hypothetical protein